MDESADVRNVASDNSTRRAIAGCIFINLFVFWATMKSFESLWPGARVRPMTLPMIWLFICLLCYAVCERAIRANWAEGNWKVVVLLILLSLLPLLAGYGAVTLQLEDIGFILKD